MWLRLFVIHVVPTLNQKVPINFCRAFGKSPLIGYYYEILWRGGLLSVPVMLLVIGIGHKCNGIRQRVRGKGPILPIDD